MADFKFTGRAGRKEVFVVPRQGDSGSTPEPAPPQVKILSVDPQFAPGLESLEIKIATRSCAAAPVLLSIRSEHYSGKILFERALRDDEKAEGERILTWDGRVDRGPRQGRWAHPLLGPFTAILLTESERAEAPFAILYHSFELRFAAPLPADMKPPETSGDAHALARLEELGYDAGPPGSTEEKKAIARFQRGHHAPGTEKLLNDKGALDEATRAAIVAARPRERWEAGKDPLKADCRLFVDDKYLADRHEPAARVFNQLPEFLAMNRKKSVENHLTQPFVALEVELRLKRKDGSPGQSPSALGPFTVAWSAEAGSAEDRVSASNPKARRYVREIQKGQNCPISAGGFASGDPTQAAREFFPATPTDQLPPWRIKGYGEVVAGSSTLSAALVDAWDEPSQHADRQGKAGAYFRHSHKGGDAAKVRAQLYFKGLPNEEWISQAHEGLNLSAETGRWTVWRRTKISAYCAQGPAKRDAAAPDWSHVRDRFNEAFLEVENGGRPYEMVNLDQVLSERRYQELVAGLPPEHRPPGVAKPEDVRYRSGALYGGPALDQKPLERPADYIARVKAAVKSWYVKPLYAVLGHLRDEVRKRQPEGSIIFDFRTYPRFDAQVWDPAAKALVPSSSPEHRDVSVPVGGFCASDGTVCLNLDFNTDPSYYFLHEGGHTHFLYHHKVRGLAHPSENPAEHDADHNDCCMSYRVRPGSGFRDYKYPFCGKCLLRLRGWDASLLPARAPQSDVAVASLVVEIPEPEPAVLGQPAVGAGGAVGALPPPATFDVIVTARNREGELIPSFTGSVSLTSVGSAPGVLGTYLYSRDNQGRHCFVVRLDQVRKGQVLQAASGAVTGQSEPLAFGPER